MGKHFWAGLLLLLLLPSICLGITVGICRIHAPICQDLEQAQQAALTQKTQQACQLVRQANGRWQHYRSFSAAFTDHEPMDEADALFAELVLYGHIGDAEQFAACCARLRTQVRAIVQASRVSWWNLL